MTSTDGPRTLSTHERAYLTSIGRCLDDLTRAKRRELLGTAAQNLAERPETASLDQLVGALGEPSDYAQVLLDEADRDEPGSIALSRARRRKALLWTRAGVTTLVIALIVGAIVTYRWWDRWQPTFGQAIGAVCAGPDGGDCDQTGFVRNDLAHVIQVPCAKGQTLTIIAGISAAPAVTVLGADVPQVSEMSSSLVRLDDVEPWPRGPNMEWPTGPVSWPVTLTPNGDQIHLHVHLSMLCPLQHWPPGSGMTINSVELRYHALGRDRTATVALMDAVQIVMPGG